MDQSHISMGQQQPHIAGTSQPMVYVAQLPQAQAGQQQVIYQQIAQPANLNFTIMQQSGQNNLVHQIQPQMVFQQPTFVPSTSQTAQNGQPSANQQMQQVYLYSQPTMFVAYHQNPYVAQQHQIQQQFQQPVQNQYDTGMTSSESRILNQNALPMTSFQKATQSLSLAHQHSYPLPGDYRRQNYTMQSRRGLESQRQYSPLKGGYGSELQSLRIERNLSQPRQQKTFGTKKHVCNCCEVSLALCKNYFPKGQGRQSKSSSSFKIDSRRVRHEESRVKGFGVPEDQASHSQSFALEGANDKPSQHTAAFGLANRLRQLTAKLTGQARHRERRQDRRRKDLFFSDEKSTSKGNSDQFEFASSYNKKDSSERSKDCSTSHTTPSHDGAAAMSGQKKRKNRRQHTDSENDPNKTVSEILSMLSEQNSGVSNKSLSSDQQQKAALNPELGNLAQMKHLLDSKEFPEPAIQKPLTQEVSAAEQENVANFFYDRNGALSAPCSQDVPIL